MDKLTKENFWDGLHEKYPGEVQWFYHWLDEYKKKVDWDFIFCNSYLKARNLTQTKFHNIPIAMQWGIFQQFCAENHPSGFGGVESTFEHPKDMEKIPELITEYFAEMKSHNDNERMTLKYGH